MKVYPGEGTFIFLWPMKSAIGLLLAMVFALFLPSGCSGESPAPSKKPNLLLISIDTLRADHLGCYGYHRATSPFIDSLVQKDGTVLFEDCISQAPNTVPSHMTLFTSLHPVVHGVPNITPKLGAHGQRYPEVTKTLSQVLKEAGYHTAGITDGGYLHPFLGFDQGFDSYECRYEGVAIKVDSAIDWFEKQGKDHQPFFLFLHTYQVHAPYLPPLPFRDRFTGSYKGWVWDYCFGSKAPPREKGIHGFSALWKKRADFRDEDVEYLKGLYDGEVAYTDSELERLWRFLEKRGFLDDLVVVILSDHGEEFGEHGEFGHKQLYDEVIRVPLILFLNQGQGNRRPVRVKDQVSLIDVMPTLLELLDMEVPSYFQGISLKPLWQGIGIQETRPAYSSLIDYGADPILSSVRIENRKLMNNFPKSEFKLFDLSKNPLEKRGANAIPEKEKERLESLLDMWQEKNLKMREVFKARPVELKVDSKIYNELKQLGY